MSAAAPPALLRQTAAMPGVNPWLVALVVSMATFMEVLDTTIVNVSLPHIAGNLSAGVDESTWVLTSYLVSNAIVLPLSYAASEPKDNINWAFGPGSHPQRRLPPLLYLGLVILAFPLLVHGPTHLVLRRVFGDNPKPSSQAGVS